MNYTKLLKSFIPATKENFPKSECTIQNKTGSNVYDSITLYCCAIVDKRFPNEIHFKILIPYIAKGLESDDNFYYAWITESGNEYIDNMENNVHNDDVFVFAFLKYVPSETKNNIVLDSIERNKMFQ